MLNSRMQPTNQVMPPMSSSGPRRSFAVSTAEYPFQDNWFALADGCVHYIDEEQGTPVLLLHGNPTWSFLYRQIVKELRSECRLIAPDYPGFGYSRAPTGYGFTPQEHAVAVAALIAGLALKDLVLVVQDWGGPIGLSCAAEHPGNIRGVVVMNSWAWEASLPQKLFSLVMGGWPLGYWLQTRLNFFARSIIPHGIYHKERLTDALRNAYTGPFPTPASRLPTWVFPRHIRKSRDWLRRLEAQLASLSGLPVQILWGGRDEPGFRPIEMRRWQRHLPLHETEVLCTRPKCSTTRRIMFRKTGPIG
jgi:haloalkane dehalogenase